VVVGIAVIPTPAITGAFQPRPQWPQGTDGEFEAGSGTEWPQTNDGEFLVSAGVGWPQTKDGEW
jgi:hypothetical protein